MKKFFYACFLGAVSCFTGKAQLVLSGTEYVQSFDSLAMGLPPGWSVDTNAKARTLGGAASGVWTPGTTTRWSNASGSFKNVASANNFSYWALATNAAQAAAADRALAVRQTASYGDPGASFGLLLAHTYKLSDLEMEFRLQSLDSPNGSKLTKWELQYGIGMKPDTFYTIAGASLVTGGNSYSNNRYTFSFGKLLDDIREPLRIRLVSLSATGGSGSRTMTALDDVRLYWKGIAHAAPNPFVQSVYPRSGDRAVPLGSLLRIRFNKPISVGTGNIYVSNETDGSRQVIGSKSLNVRVWGAEMQIAGVRMKSGHSYHVTFDSSVADTAGWLCLPVTDTTEWRFQCVDPPMMAATEYFDTACRSNLEAPGWYQFDNMGEQQWHCASEGSGNTVMRIYGNDGTKDIPNSDWLISPLVDLRAGAADILRVHFRRSDTAAAISVSLSADYPGSGDPAAGTWALLGTLKSSGSLGSWESERYLIPPAFLGQRCYVGFLYTSAYAGATEIVLDSLSVSSSLGYPEGAVQAGGGLRVVNPSSGTDVKLFFDPPGVAEAECRLYGLDGVVLYRAVEKVDPHCRMHILQDVHLSAGMYILEWRTPEKVQRCRFVVHD